MATSISTGRNPRFASIRMDYRAAARRGGAVRAGAAAQGTLSDFSCDRRHVAGLRATGPSWMLEPELALALFVAPVLLDAAFDTSLRDLRNNWLPVSTLVFVAVGLTTARGRGARALAAAGHALGGRGRARRHRRAARRGGGNRDPAPGQAALPPAQDPRRRKPAQRRQRAVDLSRRGRRCCGPAPQDGASSRPRSRSHWSEACWPAICAPGSGCR